MGEPCDDRDTLVDGDAVVVLDEVVLPEARVEEWRQLWRTSYLPAAEARGMRLRGVWSGWTENPAEICLVTCWSMRRVAGYWVARFSASEDPTVAEFWLRTDEIAVSRRRTSLDNVMPEIIGAPA